MLGRRLRRRPNIKPTVGSRLVLDLYFIAPHHVFPGKNKNSTCDRHQTPANTAWFQRWLKVGNTLKSLVTQPAVVEPAAD